MIEAQQVTQNLDGVEVWLTQKSSGHCVLSLIRVDDAHRGQGLAHKAVAKLCSLADEQGVTLVLTPEPLAGDKRTKRARLEKWYASYGFVRNAGRNKDYEISETMYRLPA